MSLNSPPMSRSTVNESDINFSLISDHLNGLAVDVDKLNWALEELDLLSKSGIKQFIAIIVKKQLPQHDFARRDSRLAKLLVVWELLQINHKLSGSEPVDTLRIARLLMNYNSSIAFLEGALGQTNFILPFVDSEYFGFIVGLHLLHPDLISLVLQAKIFPPVVKPPTTCFLRGYKNIKYSNDASLGYRLQLFDFAIVGVFNALNSANVSTQEAQRAVTTLYAYAIESEANQSAICLIAFNTTAASKIASLHFLKYAPFLLDIFKSFYQNNWYLVEEDSNYSVDQLQSLKASEELQFKILFEHIDFENYSTEDGVYKEKLVFYVHQTLLALDNSKKPLLELHLQYREFGSPLSLIAIFVFTSYYLSRYCFQQLALKSSIASLDEIMKLERIPVHSKLGLVSTGLSKVDTDETLNCSLSMLTKLVSNAQSVAPLNDKYLLETIFTTCLHCIIHSAASGNQTHSIQSFKILDMLLTTEKDLHYFFEFLFKHSSKDLHLTVVSSIVVDHFKPRANSLLQKAFPEIYNIRSYNSQKSIIVDLNSLYMAPILQ